MQHHAHWTTASGQEGSTGQANALFPYWSFTKTVIAICALKLVEDGILTLDTKLDGQDNTLHHLLAHTSGLPDYGQVPAYHASVAAQDPPWPRRELLKASLANGKLFQPGQGWSYSNIGYMFVRELIEAATSKPLGDVITEMICNPLNLDSIELAQTRDQFAKLHWDAAKEYDPRWVYHGCLTGTPRDAAKLLHALMGGDLLRPDTLAQMRITHPLGGPIPGRPWTKCGYALGLMSGEVGGAGAAIGHSGAGPFCVNAVYHFPGASDPITVASFTSGTDEGASEVDAVRHAMRMNCA